MSTEMSITRALATLKSLNARISDNSKNQVLTVPTRGVGDMLEVIDFKDTPEKAKEVIVTRWQTLNDLMEVRNSIRRAVLIANATNTINIAGKNLTIVETLDYRKSLPEKIKLLNSLKQNVTNVSGINKNAIAAYEKSLQSVRDGAMASNRKHDDDSLATFLNPITAGQKPGVLDPLNAAKIIEDMEAEIRDFELNADYALSEFNATTKIVVETKNVL